MGKSFGRIEESFVSKSWTVRDESGRSECEGEGELEAFRWCSTSDFTYVSHHVSRDNKLSSAE